MSYETVLTFNKNKKIMEHFYMNIGEDWFTYPNLYKEMIYKFKNDSHFVEVGTWKGRSAAFMAVEINNSELRIKFDCVDTWDGSIEHQDMDEIKEKQLYDIFLENIKPVRDIINPIRLTSEEASKLYEDNSLDFIFIDASHEYDDVINDITNWLPKLKEGGIIAGHDYGRYDVNRAVNDFFKGKTFTVSEDCWIHEKTFLEINNKITLVTGLWDIGRDSLNEGWSRSYEHYLTKFEQLLKTPYNLIIYGDRDLENFVKEKRTSPNTQFIYKTKDSFINGEFYEKIQKIRTDPNWFNQSGWLPDSTQARLDLYNPLVMSKMYLLHDAKILDIFKSDYFFWVDAGLTNTVSEDYFTTDLLNKLPKQIHKFSFICFPYDAENEIHGFQYEHLCKLADNKVNKVARGGFFGGHKDTISEANSMYYHLMYSTLSDGYMGTEESLFTILLYKNSINFNYFLIESNGLIYKFFEDLKNDTIKPLNESKIVNKNYQLNINNTGLYVITFNSPKQFESLIDSMLKYDRDFIDKPVKYLLDNSTDLSTTPRYIELCEKYGFKHIKKDNIGITGGRQFIAEHSHNMDHDYYFFFEDDMLFCENPFETTCKNGFNRFVGNLYRNSLEIIRNEGFDFLKLNFTEFFGDNSTQWSWYNVPQDVRTTFWPENPKLPVIGLDPNSPRTVFKNIKSYNKIPYASGEIYLCNWPQVMTKNGNFKCYIETKFANPFEQTIMSHVFQETKKGLIHPGILLITPTEHNRFEFYDSKLRREC